MLFYKFEKVNLPFINIPYEVCNRQAREIFPATTQ